MPETTAKVERTIPAPVTEVWKALTEPAKLKKFFLGADVETDWQVGSPIKMRGEFKGKPFEDKGTILTDEKYKTLSFSHFSPSMGQPDQPENYHVVTFHLEPQGKVTKVELSQANLTGGVKPSDVAHRADYEKNWSSVLDGLVQLFS